MWWLNNRCLWNNQ